MSTNKSLMEVLIEELRAAAEEESRRILKEAEEQAQKILQEAAARAEEIRAQRIKQLIAEARQKAESELAPRRLEIRRKYLAERYSYALNYLESMLSQVVRELKQNPEYYDIFLSRRLEEAIQSMRASKLVVHPCTGDSQKVHKIIREKLTALSKLKPDLEVSLGEEVECSGGIIAVSSDGREYYNGTLEAKLTEIREKTFPELLSTLLKLR
ncbi:V-type ATP synthase subunit E [Infirmifilum sp. NZ]|uniref:V-type ATP synthase subunit E n=1 Tax=Infirmifilum sp. NZ TaxID=2926850 RepID=UPI002799986E|nr:V-type ATP synthase subunit E family protein [Infirmifilum sp. NZ]UNQ72867.1 V-type ATP synthase subunit E family protein [Infirmifilum sp. NZ]